MIDLFLQICTNIFPKLSDPQSPTSPKNFSFALTVLCKQFLFFIPTRDKMSFANSGTSENLIFFAHRHLPGILPICQERLLRDDHGTRVQAWIHIRPTYKFLGTVGLKLVQRRKEHKHKRNVWPCEPQEFKRGLGPFRHSLYICHCI